MTMTTFTLQTLADIVAERASGSPDVSYTARLLQNGPERAAKKLGEEAVEAVIAAVQQDKQALVSETADILYHLMVVLHGAGISLDEIMAELQHRTAQSGLAEKAARKA